MPTDIEIAYATQLLPVAQVAQSIGLSEDALESYGRYKAKITYEALAAHSGPVRGKLILVTAITPTKSGEGKTTVTIGLSQALRKKNVLSVAALREPSMGPVFGQKGGGTGGGYSQILPMDDINLHFTGDLHAITSANNLLAAMLDNHIHFGNVLNIEPRSITFRRAIDMNERSLRSIITGVGGKANGVFREAGFDITAASEVMAALCLASDLKDLEERLSRIVVAADKSGKPVSAGDLKAASGMAVILKDALKPNLVQTVDGTPAFVHGGPFANIAHGTSSVVASRLALRLADYVVTEAGFGADLGFEKFCDIVAAFNPELTPSAVVLVATVKALKLHGRDSHESEQLKDGFANLARHGQLIEGFGLPFVVAINRFPSDSDEEIAELLALCKRASMKATVCQVYQKGGDGGLDLAQAVLDLTQSRAPQAVNPHMQSGFTRAYELDDPIIVKLEKLASRVYGAKSVSLSDEAERKMKWLDKWGYGKLPVCVAKTQYSFSDDPDLIGAPEDFSITVRELRLSAGAGFVVAVTGDIMTMPGLPKEPSAVNMAIDNHGKIKRFY